MKAEGTPTKTLIFPFNKNFDLSHFFRLENISEGAQPNCSSNVSRHDPHNIEIKTVFEIANGAFESELDVFLFVPRNFGIKLEDRRDLMKDIRSRLKLSVPFHGDNNNHGLKEILDRVQKSISQSRDPSLEMIGNEQEAQAADIMVEEARDLCALVTESFKQSAHELSRQVFLSHTLLSNLHSTLKSLHELEIQLHKKSEIMCEVRNVIVTQSSPQILKLLDEFLSYVYIQYLATVRFELDSTELTAEVKLSSEYQAARNKLEVCMNELQEKEAAHRYRVGLRFDPEETEKERELRLMKLSHLKKFFQSKSFVDFSTKNSVKHIHETLATIGTLLAALAVAGLESFKEHGATQVTFKGLFVLSFGVIAYVLRDRLKDWTKQTLNKKASAYMPDVENHLWAQNKKMGFVREWLRVESKKTIPMGIAVKRQGVDGSDLEKALPEDVLHYRKVQNILRGASDFKSNSGTSAVHENLRINLERYLKHMDDPFKDLAELDAWGSIKKSKSRRVYHFYVCARVKYKSVESKAMKLSGATKPALEKIVISRIVMDKNGVVRVEEA